MAFIKRTSIPNDRFTKLSEEEVANLTDQNVVIPEPKVETPPDVQCIDGRCEIRKDRSK